MREQWLGQCLVMSAYIFCIHRSRRECDKGSKGRTHSGRGAGNEGNPWEKRHYAIEYNQPWNANQFVQLTLLIKFATSPVRLPNGPYIYAGESVR